MVGAVAWAIYRRQNPREAATEESRVKKLGQVVEYKEAKLPTPERQAAQATQVSTGSLAPRGPVQQYVVPAQVATPAFKPRAMPPRSISYPEAVKRAEADVAAKSATPPAPPKSDILFATSKVSGVKAGLMGDMTFMLSPGIVPCTLDWQIDSTVPGPIQCTIQMDIRPRGVKLLSHGSKVHGVYQANLAQGAKRLAIAAEWMEDPSTGCFVSVPNNPMGNTLGTTGVEADIDNRYLERFGAAVALSFTQGAMSIVQSMVSQGGNTYLSFNSGNGIESLATEILRSQINIPPTATINRGTPIALIIRQPIDFSPCYDLRLKGER